MKKRVFTFMCALVLLVSLALPLSALAMVHSGYIYTANGKSLNMRISPITGADNVIANIPYGSKVTIIDYVGDIWIYAQYEDIRGYVMKRYIVNSKPVPKPTPVSDDISFKDFVTCEYSTLVRASAPGGFVNLRWAPSKKLAVHAQLYDGQQLEIIAQNNTWAQVRVLETGAVGFVMRAFLAQPDGLAH